MKVLPLLFHLKQSIIDDDIENLKAFLEAVNAMAETKKIDLEKTVNGLVENDPAHKDDIYDHYADLYDSYNAKYVEIANNSFLVTAYSFFEYELSDIAMKLQKLCKNQTVKFSNKRGESYAESHKRYIYVTSGLNFSTLDQMWKSIDSFRDFRNYIVHNGSKVRQPKESNNLIKLNSTLANRSEIKFDNKTNHFYIKDQGLLVEFLDHIKSYLTELINILLTMNNDDFD